MSKIEIMRDMYINGFTMQKIGDEYGISKQRVSKLLKKHFGITWKDGGAFVASKLRKTQNDDDKRESKNKKTEEFFMCTKEQFLEINKIELTRKETSPALEYYFQCHKARKRGVEWSITFPEWWKVWQESGHYHERGRGQGYCMARFGDIGSYSVGNVYIVTIGQNFSDSYIKSPWKERFKNRIKNNQPVI